MYPVSDIWKQRVRDFDVAAIGRVKITTQIGQEYVFSTHTEDNLEQGTSRLMSVVDETNVDPTGASLPVDSITVDVEDFDGRFNPENPNGEYFNFTDGSAIEYELGFRFFVEDTEGAIVEQVEIIPCGKYYLRSIEYDKSGSVKFTGESLPSYFDFDFEDGELEFDNTTPLPQTLGYICSQILDASPILNSVVFNYIFGAENCVINPVGGMPLAAPNSDYWDISDSMFATTTTLGMPKMNARLALCYLATASGTVFMADRYGRMKDVPTVSIGGTWNYVFGQSGCVLNETAPLYSFTKPVTGDIYSLTFDDFIGDPEYTIPQQIQTAMTSAKKYGIKITAGQLEEASFEVDVEGTLGFRDNFRVYFDKPLYNVFITSGLGASPTCLVQPEPTLVSTINYADFNALPLILDNNGRFKVSVVYPNFQMFENKITLPVSANGDIITYDNPVIDSATIAEQQLQTIVAILLRPIYTVSVYDDPALDLTDQIILTTQFATELPVTLIGRKRTFNGAIKAEYTLR